MPAVRHQRQVRVQATSPQAAQGGSDVRQMAVPEVRLRRLYDDVRCRHFQSVTVFVVVVVDGGGGGVLDLLLFLVCNRAEVMGKSNQNKTNKQTNNNNNNRR